MTQQNQLIALFSRMVDMLTPATEAVGSCVPTNNATSETSPTTNRNTDDAPEAPQRVFLVRSANAIPTRDNKLDTSRLLRSMVAIEDSTGNRPLVDFDHSWLSVGRVLDSAVRGHTLFDIIELDDSPIGQFFAADIDDWEISNEFYGPWPEREMIDDTPVGVVDGVGIRYFASLVRKGTASHYGTGVIKGKRTMAKDLEELLSRAADIGFPADHIEAMRAQAEKFSDAISANPNARSADGEEQAEDGAETVEDSAEEVTESATDGEVLEGEPMQFDIGEDVIAAVSDKVQAGFAEAIESLTALVAGIGERVDGFAEQITTATTANEALTARVAEIEAPIQQREAERREDAPANGGRVVRVGMAGSGQTVETPLTLEEQREQIKERYA